MVITVDIVVSTDIVVDISIIEEDLDRSEDSMGDFIITMVITTIIMVTATTAMLTLPGVRLTR